MVSCLDSFPFPIIAADHDLIQQLGMADADERDAQGRVLSARAVFIIAPDRRLKLSILYPATTGRNFEYVNCTRLVTQTHTQRSSSTSSS